MKYDNIKEAIFLSRPNRFIAEVITEGKKETVHVKNTGRCRELLVPGARVYIQKCDKAGRKTGYDLISVYKGDMLVNMDSQAPNKAVGEWLLKGGYFSPDVIKAECTYKSSRIDFYIEEGERRIFIEVKGVTLENHRAASFPDAPTERGTKHLRELESAVDEGYEAYVFFVVQMKGIIYFEPNRENDPEFSAELCRACEKGVKILAYDCVITKEEMTIDKEIEIRLK